MSFYRGQLWRWGLFTWRKNSEGGTGVSAASRSLMRHGETALESRRPRDGPQSVELDAKGRAQVEAAIAACRTLKPDLIVTSPLVRARQSAEIIAAGLGGIVPIVEDRQIAEVLYGRWEGMTYDELIDDDDYLRYRKSPIEIRRPAARHRAKSRRAASRQSMRAISDDRRAARPVRLARRYHPHRAVPFHGAGIAHFRRIRVDNAAFSASDRRRFRRSEIPEFAARPGPRLRYALRIENASSLPLVACL